MASFSVRRDLPMIARNEGIWEGSYRHVDADGALLDEHRARITCRVSDDPARAYHQTSHFIWEDGREERRDFVCAFRDGKLWIDNELIVGWAAEVPLDDHNRTCMLHFRRKDGADDVEIYEMIQTSDCGRYRARVWQWLQGGRTLKRTLIDEEKITSDWRSAEADLVAATIGAGAHG